MFEQLLEEVNCHSLHCVIIITHSINPISGWICSSPIYELPLIN